MTRTPPEGPANTSNPHEDLDSAYSRESSICIGESGLKTGQTRAETPKAFEITTASLKYDALDFGHLNIGAKLPEELREGHPLGQLVVNVRRPHTAGLGTDDTAESALITNQQLDLEHPRPNRPPRPWFATREWPRETPGTTDLPREPTGEIPEDAADASGE